MTQGKKAVIVGTHRAVEFQETLAQITPLLGRAGITRVSDVTGLDAVGIPVFFATRPNSRSLSVTQGKGLTPAAARASAIMEAVEHYHAESATIPLRLCRVEDVAEFGLLCQLHRLPGFCWGDAKLQPSTRLLWAPATDFRSQEERWVPFELVHLDCTAPSPEGSGHFPLSSNGLASGNTPNEAFVHGLLELIERDARTLFFLRGGPTSAPKPRLDRAQARPSAGGSGRDSAAPNTHAPGGRPGGSSSARSSPTATAFEAGALVADPNQLRVDLASVDDPACRGLLDRLHSAGLAVAVWNITSDLGVPAFLAGILDERDDPFRRLPAAYGSGCHLDRWVALARALTEAAQVRLTNVTGSRDDTLPSAMDLARDQEHQALHRAALSERGPGVDARTIPHFPFERFEEDVSFLVERLEARGMTEVLRVDLSKPSWPVSVVRVIVPGLEPLYELEDFSPGPRGLAALGVSHNANGSAHVED